jgi:hypothetical protein
MIYGTGGKIDSTTDFKKLFYEEDKRSGTE